MVFKPATAVVEVVQELERMASGEENLKPCHECLITLDEEDIEKSTR